ncbi:MAG: cyclohexa-1,5-dienecarbonyl-CoA hydratase [Acidobacteriia bacterium]|nr:cyclohexa-1,5-dienecarbonyl-CoA hydratase [Methyloceanibacter sp.]MBX5470878.1 cyclohexa-1,5-dienecarbonyl-CoA hydratase [Acetobacteraceae bacterium]MCL6491291.1 cyclohexa-1,5-dienecarbonyl-CoA hydratase [Terriglobia bacterium]
MNAAAVRAWRSCGEMLLRLRLNRPKANILDAAMIAALDTALSEGLDARPTLAVLIDAEGPNFSFGASVEEHLPAHCADMLRGFHALLLRLLALPVPVLFAVRGQCLGGGLELALTGLRIFASPEAKFGQPEIKLGVFAPAASVLLPERIARPAAEDMLLSGRSLNASEALALGLVQAVAEDPERAAELWFETHLADKSAAALRHAMKAARADLSARTRARLAALETLYLDELMQTRDALEGLQAFLAKRTPHWEHR